MEDALAQLRHLEPFRNNQLHKAKSKESQPHLVTLRVSDTHTDALQFTAWVDEDVKRANASGPQSKQAIGW